MCFNTGRKKLPFMLSQTPKKTKREKPIIVDPFDTLISTLCPLD